MSSPPPPLQSKRLSTRCFIVSAGLSPSNSYAENLRRWGRGMDIGSRTVEPLSSCPLRPPHRRQPEDGHGLSPVTAPAGDGAEPCLDVGTEERSSRVPACGGHAGPGGRGGLPAPGSQLPASSDLAGTSAPRADSSRRGAGQGGGEGATSCPLGRGGGRVCPRLRRGPEPAPSKRRGPGLTASETAGYSRRPWVNLSRLRPRVRADAKR